MDLIVYIPGETSPVHIDVSIASALSAEALGGGSDRHEGKAAAVAADHKRRDYPLINVTPFIVEDYGRFGDEALAFIRRVAPQTMLNGPRLSGTCTRSWELLCSEGRQTLY